MRSAVEFLFFRTWWTGSTGSIWDVAYRWFNLVEGAAWGALGVIVLQRFLAHRRSRLEIAYGFAFLSFGLTDFREAYAVESWLLWLKLVNLILLLRLRAVVMKRFYPESKLY